MQLNLKTMVERAEKYFPQNELVTRLDDGVLVRTNYAAFGKRVRRLASALDRIGVKPGDMVASFAWNTTEHLELYFGVPCSGAALHTTNLRLSDEHISYTINHAADKALFFSPDLLDVVERIAPELKTVDNFIILDDLPMRSTLPNLITYEELIATGDENFCLPELPEDSPASICFTSATTGDPKGVIYSHRAIYLHALMLMGADTMAISEHDTFLPIAPMFHVNSWGIPFAGVWAGAKFVFPGSRPHAAENLDLIEAEKVTFAYGAVTVGIDMMNELEENPRDISSLRYLMLGGSATPEVVMKYYLEKHNVPIFTAWGSTECAPIATTVHIKRHQADFDHDSKIAIRLRQGLPVPGVEMKVLDGQGEEVAWDDAAVGEAYVRGPWIATEYFNDDRSSEGFEDGWWKSGDVASLDGEGVLRLVDRAKDLIKSGGEWISSVDLENALMGHGAVKEAVIIAMPHEKWLERPLGIVVLQDGQDVTEAQLTEWLKPKFAKWWIPDRILIRDEIPKTGVGKFNKRLLRQRLDELLSELLSE